MTIISWMEDQKLAINLLKNSGQDNNKHKFSNVIMNNNNSPVNAQGQSQKVTRSSKSNTSRAQRNNTLWLRCEKCNAILYGKHLEDSFKVCSNCDHHFKMSSNERINSLIDSNTFCSLFNEFSPCDPLNFVDQKNYVDRLKVSQSNCKDINGKSLQDAVQTGVGIMNGIPVALGVMDFDFMGGSMGSVVGEKITRLIEYATNEGLGLVLVCASGGARMQEGVFSLMQMAKISAALEVHQNKANLPYITVLTSPTTGGVTASFAMLGNVIMAEPNSLIAFAGKRVIEQTLREELPKDFQTSEYLLKHGLVDIIVPREYMKQAIAEFLTFYKEAPFFSLKK